MLRVPCRRVRRGTPLRLMGCNPWLRRHVRPWGSQTAPLVPSSANRARRAVLVRPTRGTALREPPAAGRGSARAAVPCSAPPAAAAPANGYAGGGPGDAGQPGPGQQPRGAPRTATGAVDEEALFDRLGSHFVGSVRHTVGQSRGKNILKNPNKPNPKQTMDHS